jgi:hypothetical protein
MLAPLSGKAGVVQVTLVPQLGEHLLDDPAGLTFFEPQPDLGLAAAPVGEETEGILLCP